MAYPIGPLVAPDNYSPQATVETQLCARLTLFVSNAPIFYQLYVDGSWTQELYIPSAAQSTYFVSFDRRFSGFRVRNAVAGQAASIAGQMIPKEELP